MCFLGLLSIISVHSIILEAEAELELTSSTCGMSTSATSWIDNNGGIHIRVYSAINGVVTERCWNRNGWFTGAFYQYGTSTSVVSWKDARGNRLRVYISDGTNIKEWRCDPGSCWSPGSFFYPGVSSSATLWTAPIFGIRIYVDDGRGNTIERSYDDHGWYAGGYSS